MRRAPPDARNASSGRPGSARAACWPSSRDRRRREGARALGPLPLVRRGHHVLAGRRRSSRVPPASFRATTARRWPRSSARCSTDSAPTNADELRTIAAALSNLIGVPTTPRGTYTATEISQTELHWGIRRVLQLLARGTAAPADRRGSPLGRADAARADRATSPGQISRHGSLVLGTSRPELSEHGAPASSATATGVGSIAARAAAPTTSDALLADLLGVRGAGGSLRRARAARERGWQPALPRGDGADARPTQVSSTAKRWHRSEDGRRARRCRRASRR